ncbi:MAG TPA: histidine phosphatase family protein [Micromonosporaceae bacterium]|jgi:alpha-ribazole phosphatase/probable phosphoglycerate mutase
MATTTQIWCLRHGESANVIAGQMGAVPGAALTATGRAQAKAAAATLASLRRRPTRVYASTAVRAIQTADVLASELGLARPLVPLTGLVEVGLGLRDGDDDERVSVESAEVLRQWVVQGGLDARVANGESGHEVVARMETALRSVAADNPGGVVALVGHVASLTAGLAALCGNGADVWGQPLPHAVPFRVDTDGTTWQCKNWPR